MLKLKKDSEKTARTVIVTGKKRGKGFSRVHIMTKRLALFDVTKEEAESDPRVQDLCKRMAAKPGVFKVTVSSTYADLEKVDAGTPMAYDKTYQTYIPLAG